MGKSLYYQIQRNNELNAKWAEKKPRTPKPRCLVKKYSCISYEKISLDVLKEIIENCRG